MAVCVACGLKLDNGVLSVDTCADGGVGCGNTAGDQQCLYVKLVTNGGIVYDPSTPDQTGSPGGLRILVDPTPAGCNALVSTSEGLFVPCEQNIHDIDQAGFFGLPLGINPNGDALFRIESNKTWYYCNPGCCTVEGRLLIEAGGLAIDMDAGFYAYSRVVISGDGGATWGGLFPEHFDWFDNRGETDVQRQAIQALDESQWNLQGAGDCDEITIAYEIKVLAGTGTVSSFGANAGLEFHRDMSSVGCNICANRSNSHPPPGAFNPGNSLSWTPRG